MIRKLLFFLTSILVALASYGQQSGFQPGYIVTNTNDTIQGLIKCVNQVPYRVLVDIKFKKTGESKAKTYAPGTLLGYTTQGKIFHSQQNPDHGGVQYMELILDGYVKIYQSTVTSFGVPQYGPANSTSIYLLKTGDQHLFNPRKGKFKDRVSEYVADHEALSESVRSGEYKKRDIEDIIWIYNDSKKLRTL